MAMPPQLARAHRPKKSTRPILETLPAVTTTELRISSIYQGKRAIIKPLKIPNIAGVKVGPLTVEFHFQSLHRGQKGRTETFRLKPWRVGYGIRHAFLCNSCGRPIIRLYYHNHSLLCRWCCNGRYVSRAIASKNRPVLQAQRIQTFLDNKPRLSLKARDKLLRRFEEKALRPQGKFGTQARRLWE